MDNNLRLGQSGDWGSKVMSQPQQHQKHADHLQGLLRQRQVALQQQQQQQPNAQRTSSINLWQDHLGGYDDASDEEDDSGGDQHIQHQHQFQPQSRPGIPFHNNNSSALHQVNSPSVPQRQQQQQFVNNANPNQTPQQHNVLNTSADAAAQQYDDMNLFSDDDDDDDDNGEAVAGDDDSVEVSEDGIDDECAESGMNQGFVAEAARGSDEEDVHSDGGDSLDDPKQPLLIHNNHLEPQDRKRQPPKQLAIAPASASKVAKPQTMAVATSSFSAPIAPSCVSQGLLYQQSLQQNPENNDNRSKESNTTNNASNLSPALLPSNSAVSPTPVQQPKRISGAPHQGNMASSSAISSTAAASSRKRPSPAEWPAGRLASSDTTTGSLPTESDAKDSSHLHPRMNHAPSVAATPGIGLKKPRTASNAAAAPATRLKVACSSAIASTAPGTDATVFARNVAGISCPASAASHDDGFGSDQLPQQPPQPQLPSASATSATKVDETEETNKGAGAGDLDEERHDHESNPAEESGDRFNRIQAMGVVNSIVIHNHFHLDVESFRQFGQRQQQVSSWTPSMTDLAAAVSAAGVATAGEQQDHQHQVHSHIHSDSSSSTNTPLPVPVLLHPRQQPLQHPQQNMHSPQHLSDQQQQQVRHDGHQLHYQRQRARISSAGLQEIRKLRQHQVPQQQRLRSAASSATYTIIPGSSSASSSQSMQGSHRLPSPSSGGGSNSIAAAPCVLNSPQAQHTPIWRLSTSKAASKKPAPQHDRRGESDSATGRTPRQVDNENHPSNGMVDLGSGLQQVPKRSVFAASASSVNVSGRTGPRVFIPPSDSISQSVRVAAAAANNPSEVAQTKGVSAHQRKKAVISGGSNGKNSAKKVMAGSDPGGGAANLEDISLDEPMPSNQTSMVEEAAHFGSFFASGTLKRSGKTVVVCKFAGCGKTYIGTKESNPSLARHLSASHILAIAPFLDKFPNKYKKYHAMVDSARKQQAMDGGQ